ncbi:MAG: hypothetical protein HY246_09545 [Proteobacteria bacterium]|nr:hypothetical protein [Pseudomonadota bacterium]
MRYLLNLPLAVAILAGWLYLYLTLAWAPTSDSRIASAFYTFAAIVICWLMLTIMLAGCAAVGGFDWLPVQSRGGAIALVLAAIVALALLSALPIGLTIEAGVGGSIKTSDIGFVVWSARLVTVALPLVLLAYAAWLVNAPVELRDAAGLRYAALGVVVLLGVVATGVTIKLNAHSAAEADADAAVRQQAADQRVDENRRRLAVLTDADPLIKWDEFVGYNMPEDLRNEALRRIAARPTLEADLVAGLASKNPLWVQEVLSLIELAPFAPSATLAEPVRAAIIALADDVRQSATTARSDERDKYVDLYFPSRLARVNSVARRMADSAGIDMRDAVDAMRRAVVEAYPKSMAARAYPKEANDTARQIEKALAAKRK